MHGKITNNYNILQPRRNAGSSDGGSRDLGALEARLAQPLA